MSELISKAYLRSQYEKKFDSNAFLDLYTEVDAGEEFFLNKLYKYFITGAVKGSEILDLGCGPIFHRLAPASIKENATFEMSDFSECNRNFIHKWMDMNGSHPKFLHFFRFMAKKENHSDIEKGAHLIEERIKSKVNSVTHCDVTLSQPLGPYNKQFDVVQTCGCLESATLTYEDFTESLRNVRNLIKQGGYLILLCYLNSITYKVGDFTYPSLPVTTEMIMSGLVEAGFEILDIEDIYPEIRPRPDLAPSTGVAVALARKK